MIAAALRTRPAEPEVAASVIQVAGTSHKHVGIACREELARDAGAGAHLLQRAAASLGGRECVVLSTCNRVEVYFVAPLESGCFGRWSVLVMVSTLRPSTTARVKQRSGICSKSPVD